MQDRRTFLRASTAGLTLIALGGATWVLAGEARDREARRNRRPDGRPRLPPGQHVISRLKPMGGREGSPNPSAFRLRVHGEVDAPFELDMRGLLAMHQVEQVCDVHCVTRWTALDTHWTGVRFGDVLARAKPRSTARYAILEAAHGYTANVPLRELMNPNALIAHRYEGSALARAHGAPVRALVPDLYFWKSAKWLQGIRLVRDDEPGFWEVRGYHNRANPWKEQRHG